MTNRCSVCGEPMEEAESMFKIHGSLGPCPKPPLPKPKLDTLVEYFQRESDGEFWLDIRVDRQDWAQLGPFASAAERHAAKADMLLMMRTFGAKDLPNHPQ